MKRQMKPHLPPTHCPPIDADTGACGAGWDRATLRAVVRLNGGVRRVAGAANVAAGNLSRWLRGGTGVAPAAIARVLAAVGLPDGRPLPGVVLAWAPARLSSAEVSAGLHPYFPAGATVARPYPLPGALSLFRARHPLAALPDILALSDGACHAVLRLSPREGLPVAAIPGLAWLGGLERVARFNVTDGWERWVGLAPLRAADIVASWPDDVVEPTDADVIATVRRLGLNNAQAIDRLRGLPG